MIDEHREAYGVEPICKVLPIAPSTYHAHIAQRVDASKRSARAQRDAELKIEVQRVFAENFGVYGVRKVWRQLRREGFMVARCTVERLMASLGLQGAIRGKPVRTTISDKAVPCPLDHVNRQFHALRPNALWVSDFTYVATWAGFVYVAFVIDAYARRIVGWRVSRTAHASFVLDALEQALHDRRPAHRGGLVHHSDRGSQYVSIKYTERLVEAGVEPSVGSIGDSYDNALAETINGLYKAEIIHRRGPWRSLEAVEFATLEWVDWFNNRRLLSPSATSRRPKPRNAITPCWNTLPWRRDSNQMASVIKLHWRRAGLGWFKMSWILKIAPPTALIAAAAGGRGATRGCAHCDGKFGLIRHRWYTQQFCCKRCREPFWTSSRKIDGDCGAGSSSAPLAANFAARCEPT